MSQTLFSPVKVYFLDPTVELLQPWIPRRVHPNWISLAAACCAWLAQQSAESERPLQAFIWIMLYWIADCLDGAHARATGQTSDMGGFVDHFIDGFFALPAFYQISLMHFSINDKVFEKMIFIVLQFIWIGVLIAAHFKGELVIGVRDTGITIDEINAFWAFLALLRKIYKIGYGYRFACAFTAFSFICWILMAKKELESESAPPISQKKQNDAIFTMLAFIMHVWMSFYSQPCFAMPLAFILGSFALDKSTERHVD